MLKIKRKKSGFYWQSVLLVPVVIRGLHPHLASSSWVRGMPKHVQWMYLPGGQAYTVLQVLLEHLPLSSGQSPKCPRLGDRSFSASSASSMEREGDDDSGYFTALGMLLL